MSDKTLVQLVEYAYCNSGVEIRRTVEKSGLKHLGYRVDATKDGKVLYQSRLASDISSSATFAKACQKYNAHHTVEL